MKGHYIGILNGAVKQKCCQIYQDVNVLLVYRKGHHREVY